MRWPSPSVFARPAAAYVFPLDIEARLDDREKQILARMQRLRELDESARRD